MKRDDGHRAAWRRIGEQGSAIADARRRRQARRGGLHRSQGRWAQVWDAGCGRGTHSGCAARAMRAVLCAPHA
jgi:hypothetical protein